MSKLNFELEGYWYLPEKSDDKRYGVLNYSSKSGIFLKITDCSNFVENTNIFDFEPFRIDIIHGITDDGESVTLFNSFASHFEHKSLSVKGTFTVNSLIRGKLINNLESETIDSIYFEIEQFPIWFDHKNIGFTRNKNETIFVVKKNDHVIVNINDDMALLFLFDSKFQRPNNNKNEIAVTCGGCVKLSFNSARKIPEIISLASHFKFFFQLASLSYLKFENISLGEHILSQKRVLFLKKTRRVKKLKVALSSYNLLFSFEDIEEFFPTIMQNWFERKEKYNNIIMLINDYFIDCRNSYFSKNSFIDIVKAIEIFSKSIDKPVIKIAEETKNKIETIKDLLSNHKKEKDWLMPIMNSRLSLTLKDRIISMYRNITYLDEYKYDAFYLDRYSTLVVKNRNYYTHPTGNDKDIMNIDELYRITVDMRNLLILNIFLDIGFPKDFIKKIYDESTCFREF